MGTSAALVLAAVGSAAAALLALVALAALRSAARLLRHRRLDLPSPPETTLLLGHAIALASERSPLTMAAWAKEFGPLIKLRILDDTMTMLTDPAAIARLNRTPGVIKPGDHYRIFNLPSAKQLGLFADPGTAYWKAVRSGVAPCFSITSLKRTFPWLQRQCRLAADEVASAPGPVDVSDLAARLTADVIGDLLLSQDLGGMDRHSQRPQEGAPDYIALAQTFLVAVDYRETILFGR